LYILRLNIQHKQYNGVLMYPQPTPLSSGSWLAVKQVYGPTSFC